MIGRRPTWDDVWLGTAISIAGRSLCTRSQVGAVIVTSDNRVAAASYNGAPPNYEYPNSVVEDPDTLTCEFWCRRSNITDPDKLDPLYRDCPSVHAESNAIARSSFAETNGGTLYVTTPVCFHCAKAVAAAKIERVVWMADKRASHRDADAVRQYLEDSNIVVTVKDPLSFLSPAIE